MNKRQYKKFKKKFFHKKYYKKNRKMSSDYVSILKKRDNWKDYERILKYFNISPKELYINSTFNDYKLGNMVGNSLFPTYMDNNEISNRIQKILNDIKRS